jgi:hypothetical protein
MHKCGAKTTACSLGGSESWWGLSAMDLSDWLIVGGFGVAILITVLLASLR